MNSLSLRANISAWILIAVNLYPIFGVLYFGWDLFSIVFLYWVETLIIGLFSIIKKYYKNSRRQKENILIPILSAIIGLFFLSIYLCFLILLFSPGLEFGDAITFDEMYYLITYTSKVLLVPIILMILSHTYSFFTNFIGNREYEETNKSKNWGVGFFDRVILLHITIVIGAFVIAVTHQMMGALLLFILLKTGMDLSVHNKVHSQYRKPKYGYDPK